MLEKPPDLAYASHSNSVDTNMILLDISYIYSLLERCILNYLVDSFIDVATQ